MARIGIWRKRLHDSLKPLAFGRFMIGFMGGSRSVGADRLQEGSAVNDRRSEPKVIKPADIDPRFEWSRALPAPGHGAVDFEERIDFRRLHAYRLGRARQALRASGLGAMLCFDNNTIRYLTSTAIGEWARDKVARYAKLLVDALRVRQTGPE